MNRRHDIDALRALAFALVILYHVAMYYVAGWHWHIKSPHAAEWLQMPMRALNLWRMDLVFLISGLALGFLQRGQSRLALLRSRSWRLLLPLVFGMAVVVPFQAYAQGVANGSIAPGFGAFLLRYATGGPWPKNAFDGSDFGMTWNHLWYLPYLWLYTSVLIVLLPMLQLVAGQRLRSAFTRLRGTALLIVPALPLMAWSLLLWPHFPPTYDLIGDGWLHAVYFTLFLYGWWIGTDPHWWAETARLRWPSLGIALALLALYMGLRALPAGLAVPRQLLRLIADLHVWTALLAILGLAHVTLNHPWRWLPWANESVYPWYVLHQTLIIVGVWWLAPLRLGPVQEPVLLVAGTVLACWALTGCVRRTPWLRPLFGLKRSTRLPRLSPGRPACPSAHNA
ncbi:acyltransferase family protein [Polaromonas eurypsychrophila]|uniref:Membrane protein n=1 Tax=Polaromonas eurypsychrophila TaxID=1614635 RepID=A0A916WDB0_9BURK|nr:acyltransferase family protein [Polaromonas eurypsychrophila]GGA87710.1 membrane protein [Polaromonas eurypsychrophila]